MDEISTGDIAAVVGLKSFNYRRYIK